MRFFRLCLWLLGALLLLVVFTQFIVVVPAPESHINAQAPTGTPFHHVISSPSADTSNTPTLTPTPSDTQTPTPQPSPIPANGVLFPIGYSVEGRPIEVARFGSGPVERLIIAGIHGGYEYNTINLADYIIQYLSNYPQQIPSHVTVFVLRNLNPDGTVRDSGPDGRTNANGVDLNRNFDADWAERWADSGCWHLRPVSSGTGPLSEPETQALVTFIQGHNFDALISYHSAKLGIFAGSFPPGDQAAVRLAWAINRVSGYTYPPIYTNCEFTGQLADWATQQGIAAVDIELWTHEEIDWYENKRILETFLNWVP